MELMHPGMILCGIVVVVILMILSLVIRKKRKKFKKGIKVANEYLWEDDPYYKRRVRKFKRWSFLLFVFLFGAVFSCFMLFSRPYEEEVTKEEKHNRDIFLCLDISTSVDELNANLIPNMKKLVKSLEGDRFGIVIFNSSPVMISPLTEDTDYIIEQLGVIEEALEVRLSASDYTDDGSFDIDSWYRELYLNDAISAGTLIGNQDRGSSLIGDGLASCVFDFPNPEMKRTRIVIFCTDNDVYGTPYCTLSEAADLCKSKEITVYGIGTKLMSGTNQSDMKTQMVKTGGKFYVEEQSGTYEEIVRDIDSQSKSKIKSKTVIKRTEHPQAGFLLLLFSVSGMFLAAKITKR